MNRRSRIVFPVASHAAVCAIKVVIVANVLIGVVVFVFTELRAILVAVVASHITAHIQRIGLGVQRNDRVPFAVHKFAALLYTITDPFVEDRYLGRINCDVGNFIGCFPISPVFQVQARIGLGAIYSSSHLAATANEQAKRCSALGNNGCAREIDGVVVDNPMATRSVYETAEFACAACGYGSVVRLESIRAVAGVFAAIPNGYNGIAPAIAQKTASAVLRVAVLANGHVE